MDQPLVPNVCKRHTDSYSVYVDEERKRMQMTLLTKTELVANCLIIFKQIT